MGNNNTYIFAFMNGFIAAAALTAIASHFVLISAAPAWQNVPLLAVITAGGIPLLGLIAGKIMKGEFGADILAAISLVTAAVLGQYVAAALVILMLAGGAALESFALRRASFALRALASRMPSKAHRKDGADIIDISVSDIKPGDIITVYPHESAPVDGTVIEGHGSMDESYLTGEPYHVSKAIGASVLSGAVNGDSVLTIRAERLAQDSRFARIMEVMREAEQRRPQLRRLGDRLGAVFTPIALLVAIAAGIASNSAIRFLSVLVIATPCPLIIAIPVTIISAISLAARRGIVIRDPVILERLPTCRTAIFDKTGTLTYGAPDLVDIIPANGFHPDDVLQWTASLERYSRHPLAHAILKAAQEKNIDLQDADEVSEKPGEGLSGKIGGKSILVTHRRKHPQESAALPPVLRGLECVVLVDGKAAAAMHFQDRPRVESAHFIGHLSPVHGFNKIMLLSGDRNSEVKYLASLMGIEDARATQSPEQKVSVVQEETRKAPTLFMGDGINDAPAMTAATAGIAFGQNANVTAEAAGAVIMESSLAKVDELLHISMKLRKIALQSALGGMALSLAGMGLAAAGHITPVAGALFQEAIDGIAILNALRMTLQKEVKADIS